MTRRAAPRMVVFDVPITARQAEIIRAQGNPPAGLDAACREVAHLQAQGCAAHLWDGPGVLLDTPAGPVLRYAGATRPGEAG